VPICQAGGSPRGQAFASRWADTIITNATTVEAMKTFRQEVRKRAVGWGRDPDSIKVLYLCYPLVDVTDEAAGERRQLLAEQDGKHLDLNLSGLSRLTNIDFAKFDLDEPLPEGLTTNGHQSSLAAWIGKTPRELAIGSRRQGYELVGSIDSVASRMQEIIQETGGDGFLIFNTYFDRRYVMEVCDGLVPELQRRGVTRKAYAHKLFRDNLLEF
jgi:alkanesulfonate monooxygenase SsuD/methylene tetrahydromethanopterin reductase-like flavin-dependent oxidoreductase (luciferase family)